MTVWVTGADGMLGQEVVHALKADHTVIPTDREVSIIHEHVVRDFWNSQRTIDCIVNCAAWTAVDSAEENEEAAEALNVTAPRVLAEAAAKSNAALIHISTDYVFSGESDQPYRPDAPTNPQSVYGRTKRDGEDMVRSALDRHIIIRTAWLYGAGGKNFVSTMLRLMNEREEIGVVADQRGFPTYASDLAEAIRSVLHSVGAGLEDDSQPWGTYHYTNASSHEEDRLGISWFDFATEIYTCGRHMGLINSQCGINPLTTEQYPTPAPRPRYSVLDSQLTETQFGISPINWRDALGRFLDSMRASQDQ